MRLLFKNDSVDSDTNAQINRFMFAAFCSRFVFIYTIMILYLQKFGLNFSQIMFISSIEGIVDVIFEVPSGILADIWGKKKTVVVGVALGILGIVLFIIFPSFIIFIIAEILIDLGAALESGARSAFVFGKFEKHNIKSDYKKYITTVSRITPIISSVTALTSSYLFSINSYIPFILSAFFALISLILLISIKDDYSIIKKLKIKKYGNSIRNSVTKIITIISTSLKTFIGTRNLLILTLSSSLLLVLYSNVSYLSQAYLVDLSLPIRFMGLFYFVFNLTSSFSVRFSNKFFNEFKLKKFLVIFLLMCVFTALLSIRNLYFVIFLYLSLCFIFSFTNMIINIEIPAYTDESNRATTLSIVYFFQGIFSIIFEPLIGFVVDKIGISKMYFYVGVTSFVLVIIFVSVFRKVRKR